MVTYRINGYAQDDRTIVFNTDELRTFVNSINTGKIYANISETSGKTYFKNGNGYLSRGNVLNVYHRNTSGNITLYTSLTYDSWGTENYYQMIYRSYVGALVNGDRTNPYLYLQWNNSNSVVTGTDCYMTAFITASVPTINSVGISRDGTNKQYLISINANYADSYKLDVYKVDANGLEESSRSYTFGSGAIYIPNSILQDGNNKLKVTVYNMDVSSESYRYFNHYIPTVLNLSLTNANNIIDDDTNVTWDSTNQSRADIIANGALIGTVWGEKSYTISKGRLKLGANTIQVVVYSLSDSGVYNSQVNVTSSKNITLSRIMPTIMNLVVNNVGNLADNTTNVSWDSTNQSKVDIIANDVIIDSITSAKSYTIPVGKLKVGSNTIKVVVYYISDSITTDSQVSVTSSKTITLTRIYPQISNLIVSQYNIDEPITLKATAQDYTYISWSCGSKNLGTTYTNSININPGILTEGKFTIKAIATKTSPLGPAMASADASVNLICNIPVIYNLEPSGLNKNVDDTIVATFETNEFCDKWELVTDSNYSSSGTMVRKVLYGANTFNKGNNNLTLKTYYSPTWSNGSVTRTATKTVSFTGYGAPNTPKLIMDNIYNTATPKLEWKYDVEQVEYEYILLKDIAQVTTNTVATTDNFINFVELEDKSNYTFKIRIKNKYDLYSEWAIGSFATLFSDIILPEYYLVQSQDGVQVTIDGYQDVTFKSASVYRKYKFSDWIEIADDCNITDTVTDYTCPCNTEVSYKIRVYNTSNAYRDTEVKTIKVKLINYWLTNLEDFTQSYRLDFVKTNYNFNRNIIYKRYSNQSMPRVYKGKTRYDVVSLTVELPVQEAFEFVNFIETANDYNVFCYRTWKGERMFASVMLDSMNSINSQVIEIALTLTQINFVENKIFRGGGYRRLVYFDGKYFFDDSMDFIGYDEEVNDYV